MGMFDRMSSVSAGCRPRKWISGIVLVVTFWGHSPHLLRCQGSRIQPATFAVKENRGDFVLHPSPESSIITRLA